MCIATLLLARNESPGAVVLCLMPPMPDGAAPGPKGGSALCPVLVVKVLFDRIGFEIVRPLTPLASCHKYILVVVDYTTRYPEAAPLWNIRTDTVARELAQLSTQVVFPKQVVTDQGATFMSETLKAMWRLVGVEL